MFWAAIMEGVKLSWEVVTHLTDRIKGARCPTSAPASLQMLIAASSHRIYCRKLLSFTAKCQPLAVFDRSSRRSKALKGRATTCHSLVDLVWWDAKFLLQASLGSPLSASHLPLACGSIETKGRCRLLSDELTIELYWRSSVRRKTRFNFARN